MASHSSMEKPAWLVFRVLREELRISQTEMALRVGITQSALSRWERSGRGLAEETIAQIGQVMHRLQEGKFEESKTRLEGVAKKSTNDGRVCARIRKTLGMKQQEVADLAGVSRTSLSMFENGYLELPSGEFENLFHVLERLVQERGFAATRGVSKDSAAGPSRNVAVSLAGVEHLFSAAEHDGLRKLESQLETYADPMFRLKMAEDQIERAQQTIQELTQRHTNEKHTLAKLEAENSEHRRHKELLGDFAAAQEALISYQHEKIQALEGNSNRDFGKGVRLVAEIDAAIAETRQKVAACHNAILNELERKTAGIKGSPPAV